MNLFCEKKEWKVYEITILNVKGIYVNLLNFFDLCDFYGFIFTLHFYLYYSDRRMNLRFYSK